MFITVFTRAHPEPSESTPHLFHFLMISFNIIASMPTFSKSGFQVSPPKPCMNFFSVLCISYTHTHTHTPHLIFLDLITLIWLGIQIMMFLSCSFLQLSVPPSWIQKFFWTAAFQVAHYQARKLQYKINKYT